MKKDIYVYSDYREYLKDSIAFRKAEDPRFSHRYLCGKMGLKTPNFILLVIQGKRNLSLGSVAKLDRILKHGVEESRFFQNLVQFCQSKDDSMKLGYLRELEQIRQACSQKPLHSAAYEYFAEWYHPVVRELACVPALQGDPHRVAKLLIPKVGVARVKHSLALLERHGFLQKAKNGFEKVDVDIRTPPVVHSAIAHGFHIHMTELAVAALEQFPASERNFSSITMEVDAESYQSIVEECVAFRRRILSLTRAKKGIQKVIQMNIQIFPLTGVIQ